MKNFIHKNIRRCSLDGVIYDDSFIPRLKEEYMALIKYVELNKADDNDWFKIEMKD